MCLSGINTYSNLTQNTDAGFSHIRKKTLGANPNKVGQTVLVDCIHNSKVILKVR